MSYKYRRLYLLSANKGNRSFLQFISFLMLMLSGTFLFAQNNHMDIMTTMTGEHSFADMGWIMTTLDWNGDGHDDLIVDENGWKPPEYQNNTSIRPYGKLLFY
jgi:hypothetical protein